MPEDTHITTRLDNLEIALSHAEQQIADLSEMVNIQRQEISRLQRALIEAADRLVGLEAGQDYRTGTSVADIAASEKPPHY